MTIIAPTMTNPATVSHGAPLRLGYHPAYGSEQGHQGKGAQTGLRRRIALALEADQAARCSGW